MKVLKAVTSPRHSYRKIKQYGFGRIVIKQLQGYPALQWMSRAPVRRAKMAADPVGYAHRRKLAKELVRNSAFRNFFPEETAYKVAPPGSFDAVDKIIPAARAIFERFENKYPNGISSGASDSYLLYDLDRPYGGSFRADLRAHPQFLELACYRPFVEIASQYIGEVPILGNIDLQLITPNDTTVGFQKFHIDRNAKRQLRIFIAVEDVDEGNGATMIIPADKSAEIERELNHRYGRISDEHILSDRYHRFVQHASGPAGTTFLFDTCRTIHCGARARERARKLIMLLYVSKYSYAELLLELGKIDFDPRQVEGDKVREMLFNLR